MDYLLQVIYLTQIHMEFRGFDASSFRQFQQFQANAAAGSAAQLESKPTHLMAISATSFPAKGIPDDSEHVQR
jgi:hypothetical protein